MSLKITSTFVTKEKDLVKLSLRSATHRRVNFVSRTRLSVAIPKLPDEVNVKY